MEVHSHTHSPAHANILHKRWTHYLWEFLMLFLAVFCGFLAENIREHSIEKHREKEFMRSLLVDLQKDSSSLAYNLKAGPQIVNYGDSLSLELTRPLAGNEKRLYHFYALVSDGISFRYYDRTISQLRNSGGFRLVSKSEVSNALLDYDVLMREAVSYATGIESWSFVAPVIQISAKVFDAGIMFHIYDDARKFINHTDSIHFSAYPKLGTYNDAVIKEYNNLQRYAEFTDRIKLDYSIKAFEKNRQLDSLVRASYHIH